MSDPRIHNHGRFDRALRELRRPVQGGEIGIQRVMRAVRKKRPVTLPRMVLLAATFATVLLGASLWRVALRAPTSASSTGDDTAPFVQFVFVSADAQHVSLVGSFNDWDPSANPLRRDADLGIWSAEVPLPRGHHEYAFNVDGRWVPDADAPLGASNEFGVVNSVILVQ